MSTHYDLEGTRPMNSTVKRAPSPRAVAWRLPQIIAYVREMLVQNGADRAEAEREFPDEPPRFIKLPEVMRYTSLGEATIYRRMLAGTFPRPIRTDVAAAPKALPRLRALPVGPKPIGKVRAR